MEPDGGGGVDAITARELFQDDLSRARQNSGTEKNQEVSRDTGMLRGVRERFANIS